MFQQWIFFLVSFFISNFLPLGLCRPEWLFDSMEAGVAVSWAAARRSLPLHLRALLTPLLWIEHWWVQQHPPLRWLALCSTLFLRPFRILL